MKLKTLILTATTLLASSAAFSDVTYLNSVDDSSPAMNVKKIPNSIGVAGAYSQTIYKGVDNEFRPIPLINVFYKGFFWRGFTGGYQFYDKNDIQLSLVAMPDFTSYDASDSKALSGMEDRKYSLGLGGEATYKLQPLNLTAFATHDVTGHSNGAQIGVKATLMLPLFERKVYFMPSVGATWLNSNTVDYYYGVKDSEATASRPAYSPSETTNLNAGALVAWNITDQFQWRLGYNYTYYGSEIADSPIVDRRSASTAYTGLVYIFN